MAPPEFLPSLILKFSLCLTYGVIPDDGEFAITKPGIQKNAIYSGISQNLTPFSTLSTLKNTLSKFSFFIFSHFLHYYWLDNP